MVKKAGRSTKLLCEHLMAIIGIETIIYCVADIRKSVDFYEDFGLRLYEQDDTRTRFRLPDNSSVIIQSLRDNPIPGSGIEGIGVHEVIWGVDSEPHLERFVARVAADREVRRDADGTAHFIADGGLPMGLRVWKDFRSIRTSVDPINSPGNTNRLNTHRKWISRAYPKRMMHVVYLVPDHNSCKEFLETRLDFRLSDTQRGVGVYLRCDGATDHHNIFLFDSNSRMAGAPGGTHFNHVNFVVTDLDEVMVGKNYLERRGWARSIWGLGRHRIGSAVFFYIPCPAGGEAEYGADGDQLDDNWVPRDWDALFGFAHWTHDMPEFWIKGHNWNVGFVEGVVPQLGEIAAREYNRPAAKSDIA
jgi:catechol 2,3-dioxygenase-like lactoylglutathione lyase family enzyme